jgi:hypothetical protein
MLVQGARDVVGKDHRRDLVFFFDGVHVHAEAELVVAVGCVGVM